MLCIASFIVLLVLSIFSARFRPYVKEAYDCVFRRITFRACNTGFDVKVRTAIVVKLAKKSEKLAGLFNRYFELVSWIFVVTFLASLLWTIRGFYFYWSYGSCNGLNQSGFCVLDPGNENNAVSGTSIECSTGGDETGDLTLNNVDIESGRIVFIGCYACKYSHETYPIIRQLAEENSIQPVYVFYPTHPEAEYLLGYDYVIHKLYPDAYAEWVDWLYMTPIEEVTNEETVLSFIESMGLDINTIKLTMDDETIQKEIRRHVYEINKTGIYGTPTVFIDGKPVVGPKPLRVYRRLLLKRLF